MTHLHKLFLGVALAAFFVGPASAQSGKVTNHAFVIGKGAGVTGYTSLLCTTAQLAVGQSAADPICKTVTGDVTITSAGVTAIGAGKVTNSMIASMTSAQLAAILSDETGTGAAYFVGGALGTPSSGTGTNLTGLTLSGHAAQGAFTFVGNNTSGSASPTAVDIGALTAKASPASTDLVMISDQAASGAWKKVTVSSLASAGSVSSIDSLTGAFTTGNGVASTSNVIQLTAARRTLPTTQVFTTGSGTYTTPANVLWLEVRLVGGGGGGAASVTGTGGTVGGDTCWNTSGAACTTPVYDAGGGAGGGTQSGGSVSGSGTCDFSVGGGAGTGGSPTSSGVFSGSGGSGGNSSLGGAGGGRVASSGLAASANSGSGGAGGAVSGATNNAASGGGGGATCSKIINSPAATYTYAVGAAGTGGTTGGTGSTAGGNGAAGRIVVIEHYGS